jgi:hypothetical protein
MRHWEIGEAVFLKVKVNLTPIGNSQRVTNGFGIMTKEAIYFIGGFEVVFVIGSAKVA